MTMATKIDWQKIQVVIFDVDGTLYKQSKLRKKMLFALLRYYLFQPWKIKDMLILHHFRAEREKRPGFEAGNLEAAQYEWCAEKGNFSLPRIKQVVNSWMFEYPNKYLAACTYPGVKAFFDVLHQRQLKIGIYSDYKAVDKLKAMGLGADIVVSSTDAAIDVLKPKPKGLLYIAEKLGVEPAACLFIGDREELDGECARQANMPYLIVDKKPFDKFDFYTNMLEEISEHKLQAPAEKV